MPVVFLISLPCCSHRWDNLSVSSCPLEQACVDCRPYAACLLFFFFPFTLQWTDVRTKGLTERGQFSCFPPVLPSSLISISNTNSGRPSSQKKSIGDRKRDRRRRSWNNNNKQAKGLGLRIENRSSGPPLLKLWLLQVQPKTSWFPQKASGLLSILKSSLLLLLMMMLMLKLLGSFPSRVLLWSQKATRFS